MNTTDEIIKKTEDSNRSAPSANSQKVVWDGLTDFQKIKRKELISNNMTSVAPSSKNLGRMKGKWRTNFNTYWLTNKILVGLEDHPDMVPAGLRETKSANVHPNYTLG